MWKACLTVVSRRADSLETLINRGEHIGANVVFHVDDERMNFNFVEKVQGRIILGVSLSETKKKKKKEEEKWWKRCSLKIYMTFIALEKDWKLRILRCNNCNSRENNHQSNSHEFFWFNNVTCRAIWKHFLSHRKISQNMKRDVLFQTEIVNFCFGPSISSNTNEVISIWRTTSPFVINQKTSQKYLLKLFLFYF